MDPKSEAQTAAIAEAETRSPSEPVKLGKVNMVRLTREELAERQKADREEEERKKEARRARSGGGATVAPPSASPSAAPTALGESPSVPTNAEGLTHPMPSQIDPSATGASGFRPRQGPVLAQLLESALTLVGTEGKHLSAVSALGTRVARRLGVGGETLDLVPVAVQALYIASQLDRRGPYTPPELATLQKLLGPTWPALAPLTEASSKGGLARGKLSRSDAAAVVAAVSFFSQTRNPAAPDKVRRAAITTLKGQGLIPLEALNALAAELGL